MVRRTKADAEATRTALLDAAEQLFQANGVSRTSLQEIASAAGTTRGAIYWHFKDKADLFNAMMDRVTLPLEQSTCAARAMEAPLQQVRTSVLTALHKTATDEQARRVFEIATQQVEYNGEMLAVRERKLRWRDEYLVYLAQQFEAAAAEVHWRLPIPSCSAALGLKAILTGLLDDWLLDPRDFDLVQVGTQVMDSYLEGLGFSALEAPKAADPRAPLHAKATEDAAPPAPAGSPTPARSRKRTA
ncbi:TetR family transcriptional regulator [Hydrogenophaga flava]|uniref:TetR family transcriptional regulator n=1 Tax=Hydrogenophaga flava TaxID=65657 RepID=UPI000AF5EB75|nr:TetR family transcriptional regulator [Hydrogenophaga flava]